MIYFSWKCIYYIFALYKFLTSQARPNSRVVWIAIVCYLCEWTRESYLECMHVCTFLPPNTLNNLDSRVSSTWAIRHWSVCRVIHYVFHQMENFAFLPNKPSWHGACVQLKCDYTASKALKGFTDKNANEWIELGLGSNDEKCTCADQVPKTKSNLKTTLRKRQTAKNEPCQVW